MKTCILLLPLVVHSLFLNGFSFPITGRAFDEDSVPMVGVIVSLAVAGISDTTGADGAYYLGDNASSGLSGLRRGMQSFVVADQHVYVTLSRSTFFALRVYTIQGKLVNRIEGLRLAPGRHRLPFAAAPLAAGSYVVEIVVGGRALMIRYNPLGAGCHVQSTVLRGRAENDRMAKRAAALDTLRFSYAGQTVHTVAIDGGPRSIPDLFIARRLITGTFHGSAARLSALSARMELTNGVSHIVMLQPSMTGNAWRDTIALRYFQPAVQFRATVLAFDTLGRTIARSETRSFTYAIGDLWMPAFRLDNACPYAFAGKDITVDTSEQFALEAEAGDSFGGSIVEYRWKIDNGEWFHSDGDTVLTAPSWEDTLLCSLAVADNEGNVGYDARRVTVRTLEPGEIRIVYPRGGEVFTRGSIVPVAWKAGEVAAYYGFDIVYQCNNGMYWEKIAPESVGIGSKSFEFQWTVPAVVCESCKIKVSSYGDGSLNDVSAAFEIRPTN